MKKTTTLFILVVALAALIGAGYYFFVQDSSPTEEFDYNVVTVSEPDLYFSFDYKSGADELALYEPEVAGEPLKAVYLLVPTEDFVSVRNGDAGESPATISVFVFSKPEQPEGVDLSRIEELKQWASDNQQITGINNVLGELDEIEMDGVNALHYKTDGLYMQDIYLATYRKNIYMFVGQYDAPEDKIRTDFIEIIDSVVFD